MEPLEFLDLLTKEKFVSKDYIIEETSKGMLVAKTTSPSGRITTRMIGRG